MECKISFSSRTWHIALTAKATYITFIIFGDTDSPSQPVPKASIRRNPVRSTQHIKNRRLDLAFSKKEFHPLDTPADVKGDPRAFHRCRPEYRNISHDLSRRPPAIHFQDALLLLHKVNSAKGDIEPSDVAHCLSQLGCLAPKQAQVIRGDNEFNMLLGYSAECLPNFTNLQLLEVLQAFVRLDLSYSNKILGLYEAEFGQRAGKMDLHQLLLIADLWRCLGRSVPHYLESLYDCICQHFSEMGPPELVQFMYILGEGRKCPAHLIQPLQSHLMRHLHKLEAEEVAAVCLGLFKSKASLSEHVVRSIVDHACTLVKEMSNFGLVNVLKLLRFSHLDHLPWLEAMGSVVPQRAPQMNAPGLMHVVLACSALHYRDDRILLAVAEHLPPLASDCRSKDAAKALWAFGNLAILPKQCPSLYPCITDILRKRKAEFQLFPEHLLTALLGLAFVGQYPNDLLSLALSPEFISLASSRAHLQLGKDFFTLDGTVGIELPGWTGPRLSQAFREEVTKQLWDFAKFDICQKPEVIEAEEVLQGLLGGEAFVRKGMILPHMRSIDLEVHLDTNEQPLPVISEPTVHCTSTPNKESNPWEGPIGVNLTDDLLAQLTSAKKIPVQTPQQFIQPPALRPVEPQREREVLFGVGIDLTDCLLDAMTKRRISSSPAPDQVNSKQSVLRLAVQVTNRNHYCYRTQQLLGLHAMKRRQLELAGYRVVELPYWEWFPLLRCSKAEKRAYLHCKIFNTYDSTQRS
uniref:FAST kinase domains 5 n=1 Tax=Astyanax mexicanus TaxID=7994 RepID=A0A8B9J9P0_ASTMX